MCGICGIYHLDQNHPVVPQQLKDMTQTLHHRGPDSERPYGRGIWGLLCLELWMQIFLDSPLPTRTNKTEPMHNVRH